MNENPLIEHLFIGGSADGKWLPVEHCARRHQIESVAKVNDEPTETGEVVGDPRPRAVPVVETYEEIKVAQGGKNHTAYALNALKPEGIHMELAKHFGPGATFEWGA